MVRLNVRYKGNYHIIEKILLRHLGLAYKMYPQHIYAI